VHLVVAIALVVHPEVGEQPVGDLLGVVELRRVGEAGPLGGILTVAELVEVDRALPDEVDRDLLALAAQPMDQLLALLDDRGVVAAGQATVTGDEQHRQPA
jgi:hypothetical protein